MTTRLDQYNDLHRWVNDEIAALRQRIVELETEAHAAYRFHADPCRETSHVYEPFYAARTRRDAQQMEYIPTNLGMSSGV